MFLRCEKCRGFKIDIIGMPPAGIEQMKECVAYHMKHSRFCDPSLWPQLWSAGAATWMKTVTEFGFGPFGQCEVHRHDGFHHVVENIPETLPVEGVEYWRDRIGIRFHDYINGVSWN